MILIKNINIFSPDFLGKKDILITNNRISYISNNITIPSGNFPSIEVIDGSSLNAIPGFIDLHVHIAGAGGEGGYNTRTPEMPFTALTLNGITTCVGLLGTDGTTRSMGNLIAKARSLEKEGVSTLLWTGSYEIPTRTLTDSARSDIIFVDKIIGVGEIAISDHRASYPSEHALAHVISEARVGGLLSGKCGITHIHLGDNKSALEPLVYIIEKNEIPSENILPTHINRNSYLFEEAVDYCIKGGYIDITTGIRKNNDDVIDPVDAYFTLLERGANIEHITMSSDSGGSMPIFDNLGRLTNLTVGLPSTNLDVVKDLLLNGMDLATSIKPLTSSPGKLLKLQSKGEIKENFYADILLLDSSYNIHTVISNGKVVVSDYKPQVKGTFES